MNTERRNPQKEKKREKEKKGGIGDEKGKERIYGTKEST